MCISTCSPDIFTFLIRLLMSRAERVEDIKGHVRMECDFRGFWPPKVAGLKPFLGPFDVGSWRT